MRVKFNNLNKKNLNKKNKIILDYIDKIFVKKNIHQYLEYLEQSLNIPKKIISLYFKKKIYDNFSFTKNSFSKKITLLSLFKYFLIAIFFLTINLFKIQYKKNYKYKYLLENINSNEELKAYNKLIKLFNKKNVLISTESNLPSKFNNINFREFNIYKKILNYEIFSSIKILTKSFYLSIFTKINFAYLTLVLLKDYYFWRFFFKNFKISFLIQHQHYNSNIIKNFLLKKLCKGKTFLIQKNINTINSNGFFYDCFGIFTFSKKVAIKKKKSCSNIKKIYPVGSLFMEKSLINYSKKNIEKIDLLYLGGNKLNPNGYYDSYSSYSKDYATVLGWLKKFSKDNEHLNIVYKDHSNKKKNDHFERNFLLNSNVKFISKSIDSYHLALESKFICSWASTMIIELTACKKFSFFLDPGGRNDQFLQGIDEKKLISICSYRDLINIYNYATRAGFINNDKKKIFNETSNSTSEKIYKIINNYK